MLRYLRLEKTAYCGFVLTAQMILELMGVTPHVSLIGVEVALPVEHRRSVIAFVGDRIDTSGERAWARAIRELHKSAIQGRRARKAAISGS